MLTLTAHPYLRQHNSWGQRQEFTPHPVRLHDDWRIKRTGNPTLAGPALFAKRLCHVSTAITMFMRDHIAPELGQGRKMATYGKLVSYPKRYTHATNY
jgi:hypothetical protein